MLNREFSGVNWLFVTNRTLETCHFVLNHHFAFHFLRQMTFFTGHLRMLAIQRKPSLFVLELFDGPAVVSVAAGAVCDPIYHELPSVVVVVAVTAIGG